MNAPEPDRTDANLSEALAEVQAQIARTDTKASILLAFLAGALAGVGTAGSAVPLSVAGLIVGGVGAAGLVVAAALLLSVIRPRLKPSCPGTLPHWASLTPDQLQASVATDRRSQAVVALAGIAVAKHRALQRAVDVIRIAGLLLTLSALITMGSAV